MSEDLFNSKSRLKRNNEIKKLKKCIILIIFLI